MPAGTYNDGKYYNNRKRNQPPQRRPGARPPQRRRRKKRRGVNPLLIVALVLVVGIAGFAVWRVNENKKEEQARLEAQLLAQQQALLAQDTFYDGIFIAGLDVSGMTRAEAEALLQSQGAGEQKSLLIQGGETSHRIDLVAGSNTQAVLDEAWAIGREGSSEERISQIASLQLNPRHLEPEKGYSVVDMAAELEAISTLMDTPAQDAKVTGFDVSSKTFKVEEGKAGRIVDAADLQSKIEAAIAAGDFDAAIAVSFIAAEPAVTTSQLDSSQLLAKFSTTYKSNANRDENIRLCSTALTGSFVMPGEEYSINQITGERTPKKGYQEANVIKNGEYVPEPGGGVCQVSSTLFNAVVRAGLNVTERHNHTIKSSYVPESEDAAIDYPHKDFKFVNNSKGPVAVVFKMDTAEKTLTAYVYGTPILGEGETLELATELLSETPQPENKYVVDSTLAYGEEVLKAEGRGGAKYRTYLVKKKNGKEVSREVLHTSNYPAKASTYATNPDALPGTGDYDVPSEPSGGGNDPVVIPPEDGGMDIPEE